MTESGEEQRALEDLVNRLCDGLLTDDEKLRLDEMLHNSPWAIEYYLSQVQLHARLLWCSGYPHLDEMAHLDCNNKIGGLLLSSIVADSDSNNVKTERDTEVRFAEKPQKLLAVLASVSGWSVAACLLIIALSFGGGRSLLTRLMPSDRRLEPSVRLQEAIQTTLTREADVQWSGAIPSPKLGSHPGTQLMQVLSGRIQMTFDNGVEVLVEGPAEFSHDGFGAMTLNFGTLTAVVPNRVARFSVYTSSAIVECSGKSEFGLIVEESGLSDVHVLQGLVSTGLLSDADESGSEDYSQSIQSGHAVRIERDARMIFPIDFDAERFSRISIQCLDVVDLLSGGNGYGEHLVLGIDASSGEQISPHDLPLGTFHSDGAYHHIEWNTYADGLFVPTSSGEPVRLDSSGHTYSLFPAVSGESWVGGIMLHRSGFEQPVSLGPRPDGGTGVCNWLQSRSSSDLAGLTGAFLGLHANCGLTLDLKEIGRTVTDGHLGYFHSELLHARPRHPENRHPVARPPVLWVFVDGKLHASYRPSAPFRPVNIDVPLQFGQRFLTLVVTDGDRTIDEDWMVLANPILKWLAISPDSI